MIFVLVRLAPGDPVDFMLGETGASPEFIEQMRKDLGLDQPIYVQYIRYVRDVATRRSRLFLRLARTGVRTYPRTVPGDVPSDDHAIHCGHRVWNWSRRALRAAAELGLRQHRDGAVAGELRHSRASGSGR